MKHLLYLLTALLFVPVSVNAQDDMYFTPKKQKKAEQVVKEQKSATPVTELKTYDKDDVIYNGTGRLSDAKVDTIYAGEAMPNDTLYIDEYETFEDGNGGRWINGFKGGVDDYKYALRNMNWRTMRSAIPVGSSAYWNLTFGASSFDWNIYEVGGLAYLFPTWSNPLYWDYRISPSWGFGGRPWSWSYSPWHYGRYYAWGMYDPWFDPWYDSFYVWSSGGWGWGYSWHGIGHYHYAFDPIRRNPGRSAATYTIGGRGYHIGDRGNVASRNRSEAGTRGQVHRIQDRAAARSEQGSRVTGRSVRSTNDGSRSANSVRPTTGSRSQMDAGSRGTATRSTSSYSRGADGRNSTYSRPSSTRVSTARNSERGSMSRASSVRSVNGSSRGSVSMDRMGSRSSSNSGGSTRSSGSYSSGSSSRSSVGSFSSGGGSRSGGSFSGGGSSSGGSRSGGGGRR